MENHNEENRIKSARLALGMTKEELGQRCGVSAVAVHYWEIGHNKPRGKNLLALAKALGVSPAHIAGSDAENTVREQAAAYNSKPPLVPWAEIATWPADTLTTELPQAHGIPGVPSAATITLDKTEKAIAGRLVVAQHAAGASPAVYRAAAHGPAIYLEPLSGNYPPIAQDEKWHIVGVITRVSYSL